MGRPGGPAAGPVGLAACVSGVLLLHDVEVDGRRVDVTIAATGRIEAVTPVTGRRRGPDVVQGGGGALLPGLHDHHLHLLAMAAARASVPLGPPEVADAAGLVRALRTAVDDAPAPAGAWVRGVGYHESVAGDLDAATLDRLVPTARPVRIQHRSGACWILNGAALAVLGAAGGVTPTGFERTGDGRPTGRLYGLDDWLGDRVPRRAPDLDAVGRGLAAYGVTGVTDATPTDRTDDVTLLAEAVARGLAVRVVVTGGPNLAPDAGPGLARGPVKLVVTDHDLPPIDALVAGIGAARRQGRAVAVHCVTLAGLVLALAAWDEAGGAVPGDRIEHAAVVPADLVGELAARGLTVVTQPRFVHARGDAYLDDVEPADRDGLWRCGTLLAAGVAVAGSSDAPFGPADPWAAMATAVARTTAGGRPLGPGEAVDGAVALGLYLAPLERPGAPARRVAPGAPADCCLLDRPLAAALAAPDGRHVALTLAAGRVTHRA